MTLYQGAFLPNAFSEEYYQRMRDALDSLSELVGKEEAHAYFASLPQFRSPMYLWVMLEKEYNRRELELR